MPATVSAAPVVARQVTRSPKARNPIGSAKSGEVDESTVPRAMPAYFSPAVNVDGADRGEDAEGATRRPMPPALGPERARGATRPRGRPEQERAERQAHGLDRQRLDLPEGRLHQRGAHRPGEGHERPPGQPQAAAAVRASATIGAPSLTIRSKPAERDHGRRRGSDGDPLAEPPERQHAREQGIPRGRDRHGAGESERPGALEERGVADAERDQDAQHDAGPRQRADVRRAPGRRRGRGRPAPGGCWRRPTG